MENLLDNEFDSRNFSDEEIYTFLEKDIIFNNSIDAVCFILSVNINASQS